MGSGQGGVQVHTWGCPDPQPGGVSKPTAEGCVQAQAGGCIPACTEVETPSRRLLLQVVRILLECILVKYIFENFAFVNCCKSSI